MKASEYDDDDDVMKPTTPSIRTIIVLLALALASNGDKDDADMFTILDVPAAADECCC